MPCGDDDARVPPQPPASLRRGQKLQMSVFVSVFVSLTPRRSHRYKLRAKVEVTDASGEMSVCGATGPNVGAWYTNATSSTGASEAYHILQVGRFFKLEPISGRPHKP